MEPDTTQGRVCAPFPGSRPAGKLKRDTVCSYRPGSHVWTCLIPAGTPVDAIRAGTGEMLYAARWVAGEPGSIQRWDTEHHALYVSPDDVILS